MNPHHVPLTLDLDVAELSQTDAMRAVTEISDPPKPSQIPRQQLGARISVDVYKRPCMRAGTEDVRLQELIERAVVEFLDRGEPPHV